MNVADMLSQMSSGMIETGKIFIFTIIFTLPLGLLIAFGRMSRIKIIKYFTMFYISVMRGTPLMLQLFVVYFGPSLILGMRMTPEYKFYAVIIGFVINYAAYFAEIYRAGIEAIPKGQYEAAEVLGYSKAQTFVKIILPQVIKRILPPVTNEIMTLVKDTSLAYCIGYIEMFAVAKQLVAAKTTLMPFLIAGVFYYVVNLLVGIIMGAFEKKLSYYR